VANDSDRDQWKRAAAESAVAQVQDGMIVGLGTGSTAWFAVEAIGRRVAEGLRIVGIPTSDYTQQHAHRLGISLSTLAENPRIDLTIDGADEVELATLALIKGGGGALLREKIVASSTARLLIVVDEAKLVEHLGAFPVPVEVVPFGWQATAQKIASLGPAPVLRIGPDGKPYVTDGGHYILDCRFEQITSPRELDGRLNGVVGVVEHGICVGLASQVIAAGAGGVRSLSPEQHPKVASG